MANPDHVAKLLAVTADEWAAWRSSKGIKPDLRDAVLSDPNPDWALRGIRMRGYIFDVLTAADEPRSKIQELLPSFGRVVAGGGVEWSAEWIKRLDEYVPNGGTLVLSASLS